MPEKGGPTTWSGIYFQDQIVVSHLVTMIWEHCINHEDPVINVRVEAPVSVDDILVTKQSGARLFQSVKEGVAYSAGPNTPWGRMWTTIYEQWRKDFDIDRDIIEIVFPIQDALRKSLDELTRRASTYRNLSELQGRLSQEQGRLLTELQNLLGMTDDETHALLRATRIAFSGDAARLHQHLVAMLVAVYPYDAPAREQVIDTLAHLVLQGGRIRREFNFDSVAKALAGRGISLTEALHNAFKIINQIPGQTSPSEAQQFFRGFEATWSAVRDDIPVSRTFYTRKHRAPLLEEAAKLNNQGGLSVYVILGPRGVGKTTLAKQIAVDLSSSGHFVAWHEGFPRRLDAALAAEFQRLLTRNERVHLFSELGLPRSTMQPPTTVDHVLKDLAEFLFSFRKNPRLSVYLTVDSNHYEVVRDDLEDIVGSEPQVITVPLNLDNTEIDSLIKNLRRWSALGRLVTRPDSEIHQIFQRKSHKILLVALIEAIAGMDEKENFHNIVRREYEALPLSVQLAYPLVAVNHSYDLPVPLSLVSAALGKVPSGVSPSLEQFRTLLRDVITFRGDRVTTRHPLIARTLCEALSTSESAESVLWMPILSAILRCIDQNDDSHVCYLQEFAAAKVTGILKENLDALGEQVVGGRFPNLPAHLCGPVLNAVARTHQGRANLGAAISWALKSRDEIWRSDANGADVILMYCYLATRNRVDAVAMAERLAKQSTNPWHLLHAVRVLCKAGKRNEARVAFEAHREKMGRLPGFGRVYEEVLRATVIHEDFPRAGNSWAHARWVSSRLDLGQIEPLEAIDRLTEILDQQPNIHRAFADACHLLFIEDRYDDVIALCDKVLATASSKKGGVQATDQKVNPDETCSMALATKAWAIFRRQGIAAAQVVEDLFQQSLGLKQDNAWCHNWRGLYLHQIEKESGIAERELREALHSNRKIPPFYRNLARVILETNVSPFSRQRNKEVINLCEDGLALCPPESYWNWGGLRAIIGAILYCARSLETQHLPDRIVLPGGLSVQLEDPDIGSHLEHR